MKIPNADHAEIAPSKLKDYLLNSEHRRGGTKAALLFSLGYNRAEWRRLELDLRDQHLMTDISLERNTVYDRRFEVVAPIAHAFRTSAHLPQHLAN